VLQQEAQPARAEATAALAEEHRAARVGMCRGQRRAPPLEVGHELVPGRARDREQAALVALAVAHDHQALVVVEVGQVEGQGLLVADARGVDQLDHGAVPEAARRGDVHIEQCNQGRFVFWREFAFVRSAAMLDHE
jgi:hypothetical protein